MQQQASQQRSTVMTSVSLSDKELMVIQQQQQTHQQQQQSVTMPSYSDYAGFDAATAAGLGQTATVSAVDEPEASHIDELVVPLSTTTATAAAMMSSVEPAASSLMYMDPDTSYATSLKDSRGLLNEQTNVCKVRRMSSCKVLTVNVE